MTSSRDESPEAALHRLRRKLQLESAEVAIDALTEVARDPKSTAQARSTAGAALLRAAGFFADRGDPAGKDHHEMTAEELAAEGRRLQAALSGRRSAEQADDVFS